MFAGYMDLRKQIMELAVFKHDSRFTASDVFLIQGKQVIEYDR